MNIGASFSCLPLLIMLHIAFILCHHLVTGQHWLLNSIFPMDYDVEQAPLQSADDFLMIHGTIWMKQLHAKDDQRVSETISKYFAIVVPIFSSFIDL